MTCLHYGGRLEGLGWEQELFGEGLWIYHALGAKSRKWEFSHKTQNIKRSAADDSSAPHGRITLDIECKGVLSIGNRVGVGLNWSVLSPLLPSLFPDKGAGKKRPRGIDPLVGPDNTKGSLINSALGALVLQQLTIIDYGAQLHLYTWNSRSVNFHTKQKKMACVVLHTTLGAG